MKIKILTGKALLCPSSGQSKAFLFIIPQAPSEFYSLSKHEQMTGSLFDAIWCGEDGYFSSICDFMPAHPHTI